MTSLIDRQTDGTLLRLSLQTDIGTNVQITKQTGSQTKAWRTAISMDLRPDRPLSTYRRRKTRQGKIDQS